MKISQRIARMRAELERREKPLVIERNLCPWKRAQDRPAPPESTTAPASTAEQQPFL